MDTKEVWVESEWPEIKLRWSSVFLRLVALGLMILVTVSLLTEPHILSPVFWSAASLDKHPTLGRVLEIGTRAAVYFCVCNSSSISVGLLWLLLIGLKRKVRWFQISEEHLVVGYAGGAQEEIRLSEIKLVRARSISPGTLTTLTVTTRAGKKATLRSVTGGPDAVDKFCAECSRRNVPVTGETRSLWRVLAPFLAAGPVLILAVAVVRYVLRWLP